MREEEKGTFKLKRNLNSTISLDIIAGSVPCLFYSPYISIIHLSPLAVTPFTLMCVRSGMDDASKISSEGERLLDTIEICLGVHHVTNTYPGHGVSSLCGKVAALRDFFFI